MRRLSPSAAVWAALLLAAAPLVWAQPADPAALFPLEVGRAWTYRMRIAAGEQRHSIEYTAKVARVEEVAGVGPCAVIESRSNRRLMQVNWFVRDAGKILNPLRQDGANEAARQRSPGRVFLDLEAAAAVLAGEGAAKPSWTWSIPDGSAAGKTTIEGTEALHLRNFGLLECLVVVANGRYTLGETVRLQERRLWLAPGLGLVKETMRVQKESGEVVIESDALLIRHQSP